MPSHAELEEPPEFAVAALARELRHIADQNPDAWTIAFLDLIDKALRATPSVHLVSIVRAALASAPEDDVDVARAATDEFAARIRGALRSGDRLQPSERADLEVLWVVPKPLERRACAAVLECEDVETKPFDSQIRYRRFQLASGEPRRVVVTLVCMQEAGNILASNVIRDYVGAFGRPDLAVLCGTAMGINDDDDKKVAVGDVVIATSILDFGPRRVTPEGDRPRPAMFTVPAHLQNALAALADPDSDPNRAGRIAEIYGRAFDRLEAKGVTIPAEARGTDYRPKARPAVVRSGDELVEDGSGAARRAPHDRIHALEMEGAGFAATCHHIGCDWTVIRGISDEGESDRGKDWQPVATSVAAAYVRALIESDWRPPFAAAALPRP